MILTTTKPPARYWTDVAYDPEGNRIILFGGSQGGGNDLGDTWVYGCREAKWTQVSSTVSPPARSQPSMAYDTQTKRTFMFGGADFIVSATFKYYNDIWALDRDNQWVEIKGAGQTAEPTETSSGVPGFQPFEVAFGCILAIAMLLWLRRRNLTGLVVS